MNNVCDACAKFFEDCWNDDQEEPRANLKNIITGWKTIFYQICQNEFKFNKPGTDFLWENLAIGNWEHLHPTNKEEEQSYNERLSDFFYDMFYCSDRWSMDRLLRVHWQLRHAILGSPEYKYYCEDFSEDRWDPSYLCA